MQQTYSQLPLSAKLQQKFKNKIKNVFNGIYVLILYIFIFKVMVVDIKLFYKGVIVLKIFPHIMACP